VLTLAETNVSWCLSRQTSPHLSFSYVGQGHKSTKRLVGRKSRRGESVASSRSWTAPDLSRGLEMFLPCFLKWNIAGSRQNIDAFLTAAQNGSNPARTNGLVWP
jgi:hypothetical protein